MARQPQSILEEFDDNRPLDVEHDPDDDFPSLSGPYDPRLIRVDPKVYSVRQILDMIDDEELDLAPDFQRRRVWRSKQQSLLIESMLLRIPLPAFYFSADSDGLLQVVDGVQRLHCIHNFVRGHAKLDHLEYLKQLEGFTYRQLLGTVWARRILNTQIMANVIDPQTPSAVKFDIFRRINTGGSPLNPQEIRHCMTGPRSRGFLRGLCDLPEFIETMGPTIVNHVRMVDRELALRYVAFKLVGDFGNYKQSESMDGFLTDIAQQLDDQTLISKQQLNALSQGFALALTNAKVLFGDRAFRKWPAGSDARFPTNRALFDVWSVMLSDKDTDEIKRVKRHLVTNARAMMADDDEFLSAITTATSSPAKILVRFDRIKELLENYLL